MSETVDTEKLYEHLQAVIRDSEALLKATASFAGEHVQKARTKAEESLQAAKQRLTDVEDDVVQQAREFVRSGQQYVHDRPWQSIGWAAVIGFVLGAVLMRSGGGRGREL